MVSQNFVPAQVTKGAGKITSELLQTAAAIRRNYSINLNFLPKSTNVLAVIPDHHQESFSPHEILQLPSSGKSNFYHLKFTF